MPDRTNADEASAGWFLHGRESRLKDTEIFGLSRHTPDHRIPLTLRYVYLLGI
jgi:hypothetical protein